MAKTARDFEKKKSSVMFREITPPHEWNEETDFHYLRLTLPGFGANDIHLRVDKYGHLVVRGDNQISEHKYISFEETFDVPEDADLENADGLFEDNNIYCIIIPKIKEGQRSGHAITIPNNNPQPPDTRTGPIIHNPNSIGKPQGSPKPLPKIPHNPIGVVRGDKSKRKIAFFLAVLIALLVIAVALVVKFRHQ